MPEIGFRRVEAGDFPLMTAWLAEPHVRRFYQKQPVTLAEVAEEYGAMVRGEEPSMGHLALSGGRPFAYLQCYRNADYPQWAAIIGAADGISLDLYIGDPAFVGRGFGQAALAAYLDQVAFPLHPGEDRAYIAHETVNAAALRCSQAVGFRPLRTVFEDGAENLLLAIERPGRDLP